ncbi:MAG: DUF6481 family protein [Pseudomonadota bacterium]
MTAFQNPTFQERQEAAARARMEALAKYRDRPVVDPAVMADRAKRRAEREAAAAEKRIAISRAKIEAEERKREQEREALAAEQAAAEAKVQMIAQAKAEATARNVAERKMWTEDDRKAARDARYAARKTRQGRR